MIDTRDGQRVGSKSYEENQQGTIPSHRAISERISTTTIKDTKQTPGSGPGLDDLEEQTDVDAETKRMAENVVNRLETKKCLFVNVKETISGPTPAAS